MSREQQLSSLTLAIALSFSLDDTQLLTALFGTTEHDLDCTALIDLVVVMANADKLVCFLQCLVIICISSSKDH